MEAKAYSKRDAKELRNLLEADIYNTNRDPHKLLEEIWSYTLYLEKRIEKLERKNNRIKKNG
jgi:hypothetical protein